LIFFLLFNCASAPPGGSVEDAELFTDRGRGYLLTMNYKDALKDFNHAIRLNPDYQPAYKYRGLTYIMLKRDIKAILDFVDATWLLRDDPEIYYLLGTYYIAHGRFRKALEYYDKAEQLNPEFFISSYIYFVRGQLHLFSGDFNKALDNFNKYYQTDESVKNVDFYIDRSRAYSGMQSYPEALADINTAIGLAPHNGDGYYYRSNVYEQTGRYQEALDDIKTALQLQPEKKRIYNKVIKRIEKAMANSVPKS
jgi:tetratricopeptide (TPR) repeat protein